MLDNANNNSSLNVNSSQSSAVWQSGWIDELWSQLSNGTFDGVGNVVVDEDVTQSEQHILSDLSAIDRMLTGNKDIRQMLSEVRDFAEQNRTAFGNRLGRTSGIDSLTGTDFDAQAYQAAASLTEVLQYVQEQGLPDLTAEVGALTFDTVALPGEKAKLSFTLKNQGNLRTRHPVNVKIFAQAQSGLDGSASNPIEIGERSFRNLKLNPGSSRSLSTTVQLPDDFAPGNYNIFVAVDTAGSVPESDETNNVAVAADIQTVAWQFGNIGGENKALTLSDSDGKAILFRLKGDGYGEVTEQQGVKQLNIYGTNDQSEVIIKDHGNGHILETVVINGDLKRLNAQNTDLAGKLTIRGSIQKLELDDVSNAQIAIGQTTNPDHVVDIKLGDVSNTRLVSASRIDDLDAASWTRTGDISNIVVAPEIREIDIKGDFSANLSVTGDVKTIKATGIASGVWQVGGDNRLTKLGATAEA